jgi:hypothetical protein
MSGEEGPARDNEPCLTMASPRTPDKPPGQYGDLLPSIVVLLGLAIAGVVVLALGGTTREHVLALAAMAEATVGTGLATRGLLADADGSSVPRSARRSARLLGAVAAATLVVALAVPG